MRSRWVCCFLFMGLIFVSGCQGDSASEKVPKALEGIHVLAGPGKYAGNRYDAEKVRAEIDRFPKNRPPEEYYERLLGLLAEDYLPYLEFFETYDPSLGIDGLGPAGVEALKLPEEKWRAWDLWEDQQSQKVDREEDRKFLDVDVMEDKMVLLADLEEDRLTLAVDYLEDVVQTDVRVLYDWINRRESVLQDYANNRELELQEQLKKNETMLFNELDKMEADAYNQYHK